jgi:hypothetical protein
MRHLNPIRVMAFVLFVGSLFAANSPSTAPQCASLRGRELAGREWVGKMPRLELLDISRIHLVGNHPAFNSLTNGGQVRRIVLHRDGRSVWA